MKPIDATNLFKVAVEGELIVLGENVKCITKGQALNLAAWLVVMARPDSGAFAAMFGAVGELGDYVKATSADAGTV